MIRMMLPLLMLSAVAQDEKLPTYTDDELEISVPIPEGWSVTRKKERALELKAPQEGTSPTFADEELEMSVPIPEGWNVTRQKGPGAALKMKAADDSGSNFNIRIMPPMQIKKGTWRDYLSQVTSILKGRYPDYEVTETSEETCCGNPALLTRATLTHEGVRFEQVQYLVAGEKHTYGMTWTARGEHVDDMMPLFKRFSRAFILPGKKEGEEEKTPTDGEERGKKEDDR